MADAALLSVRGLTRRFGGLTAVGGVDLDLHEGEVHAVIGTNGAGKTTTIRCILGIMTPDGGSAACSRGNAAGAGRSGALQATARRSTIWPRVRNSVSPEA